MLITVVCSAGAPAPAPSTTKASTVGYGRHLLAKAPAPAPGGKYLCHIPADSTNAVTRFDWYEHFSDRSDARKAAPRASRRCSYACGMICISLSCLPGVLQCIVSLESL